MLRWLQRTKDGVVEGVDLDALSTAELERLHARLVRLCSLPSDELEAVVREIVDEHQMYR